jgi:FkbM family methyltransferase
MPRIASASAKGRSGGGGSGKPSLQLILLISVPIVSLALACLQLWSIIDEKDAMIRRLASELHNGGQQLSAASEPGPDMDLRPPRLRSPPPPASPLLSAPLRQPPPPPPPPPPQQLLAASPPAPSYNTQPEATTFGAAPAATHSLSLGSTQACRKEWQVDAFHRLKEYGGLSVELLFDKLGRTSQFQPLLVFDVGANTGLSTEMILKWTAAVHGPSRALTTIHSFEPNKLAYSQLSSFVEKLRPRYAASATVTLHGVAVSDTTGSATLYSATKRPGMEKQRTAWATLNKKGNVLGTVETVTLDDFVKQNIDASTLPLNFLKIDTEGHDANVLKGCEGLLAAANVELIVFEFGSNWGANGKYLRDAVALLAKHGYASFLLGSSFHIRLDGGLFDDVYETVRLGNVMAMKPDYPLWDELTLQNSKQGGAALLEACP